MMKETLTNKDYEMISAFLDQELDESDMLAFADRMSSEADLHEEMQDLYKIKQLARQIPEVKPPRSYVLTQKMAQETRKPGLLERLFPVFRTAAAFCSLALILTFLLPGMLSAQKNSSSYAAKSVPAIEMMAESAEEAMPSASYMADEEVVLDSSDRYSGGYTDVKPAAMPSFGNYGGTPQIAFRIISKGTDSRNDIDYETAAPAAESDTSLNTVIAEKWTFLLRAVLVVILAISLVWIILSLIRRQKLKVSE